MARKKKSEEEDLFPTDMPLYWGFTPNQVVAFNLARAREEKGWTQEQAAEALEPYLGKRWSKASVSQAERSIGGKFIRNFDADEIVAFARAFELPVTWFFMPPPPWSHLPGVPVRLSTPDAERFGTALAVLVDLVFGDASNQALLTLRLRAFLQQLGPNPLSDAQQRVVELARRRTEALARHAFEDLSYWRSMLRRLANELETLEIRAKHQVAQDLDVEASELQIPIPPLEDDDVDGWAFTEDTTTEPDSGDEQEEEQ